VHNFRQGFLQKFSRIAGCVAAYAFVLNILLVALSGALNAGNASYDGSWAELCQQSADGTATPGDTAPKHAAKFHCLLCVAGSQLAAVAPDTFDSAIVPVSVSFVPVVHLDAGDNVPLSVVYLSKPPRGPPHRA
jgi:hypothetical protein